MQRTLNTLVVVIAVGWGAVTSYNWFQSLTEPLIIHSSRAEQATIKYGAPLILIGETTRTKQCPSESHRQVTDETGTVVYRAINPAASVKMGWQSVRISTPLPAHLRPGHYVYNAIVYTVCDDRTYTAVGPRIPFEIIE